MQRGGVADDTLEIIPGAARKLFGCELKSRAAIKSVPRKEFIPAVFQPAQPRNVYCFK
jgi:hypothetical protein